MIITGQPFCSWYSLSM